MPGLPRFLTPSRLLSCLVIPLALLGCSSSSSSRPTRPATSDKAVVSTPARPATARPAQDFVYPVMPGIDVLTMQGFAPVKGKRLGLLTHPAGVNRLGEKTIDVLRRAPGVNLVALYGPEHGIYGDTPAEIIINDSKDPRTGLPVFSLYGKFRKPVAAQLKNIDAMVIDLQDVGARSYTFISAMKLTMEACFEHNIEVIVLDRPNPLGGLKVDGPLLDAKWRSYVGEFRVPYVHGLTIAELAKMAKEAPGVLNIPDDVRARGRLTIIPMRGWKRSMRWPETGLTWIPTSPFVPDFAAVQGYAMTGLGTYLGGFYHGVGKQYPFRGLGHRTIKIDEVEKELKALKIPGLQFRRVSGVNRAGKPAVGLYIEISDYDEWRPTELSFYLMKLACKLEPANPFNAAPVAQQNGFLRHMGSEEFLRVLQRDGARTDVATWIEEWHKRALVYQMQSRRYWLYQ